MVDPSSDADSTRRAGEPLIGGVSFTIACYEKGDSDNQKKDLSLEELRAGVAIACRLQFDKTSNVLQFDQQ